MRVVPCSIIIACLAGLPGCSLFNKSSGTGTAGLLPGGGRAPAKFPAGNDPLFSTTAQAGKGEILAGHVIDGFNSRPQVAYIQYVSLEEGKGDAAPVEVAANGGYFTIPGLKRGASYKLTARAKNGEKLMAGTAVVTAPNPRIVIHVREDLVSSTTPPIPDPPAYKKEETSQNNSERQVGAATWGPATEPVPPRANVPANQTTPTGGWIPGIAVTGNNWPPAASIPPQTSANPPTININRPIAVPGVPESQDRTPPVSVPSENRPQVGAARVPSCVLVGKQLVNFALNDLNGEPWEFKRHRKGKLVLIDFWGTTCLPCRETVPHLRNLQAQHGWSGLEVIGIAYETGGSPQEQAHRVASACQKLQTNYRQLLGANPNCPVREQFGVRFIPHMVLVDETGQILWRHEGRFDGNELQQLDLLIRRRLGVR